MPPKTLNVLHNSEQPATVFSVLENANKTVVFTSDTLFDLLLLKLTNVYSKKFKIESKGARFEIGDFLVKLGIVSAAGSVKVDSKPELLSGNSKEIKMLPFLPPTSWGGKPVPRKSAGGKEGSVFFYSSTGLLVPD